MQTNILSSLQFRALKGAPATILLLFLFEKKTLSQEYISRNTGYSGKSVHEAVMVLRDFGLISPSGRYEWALTNGAQQLPLGAVLGDGDEAIEQDETTPDRTENLRPNPSSSSSRYLIDLTPEVNPLPLPERNSPEKLRPDPPNPEILAVLDEHGVREPARSRLARLAHVTPELVDYHCKTAQNTGLAIYRIEKNWAVKTEAEPGKYYEDEFGEFVNH
jgi:hypothetical protein